MQTLRISRLYSYNKNFTKHKANMKSWFLKRQYPEKLISAEMDEISFQYRKKKKLQTSEGYTSSSDIAPSA